MCVIMGMGVHVCISVMCTYFISYLIFLCCNWTAQTVSLYTCNDNKALFYLVMFGRFDFDDTLGVIFDSFHIFVHRLVKD